MSSEAAAKNLRTRLRGELIEPGNTEYEAARKVFNAMIDKRPAMIACCAGAADVVACVDFARQRSVPLAVRGGERLRAIRPACSSMPF